MRATALGLTLLIFGASALGAQGRPLRVEGVRALAFGVLFPGISNAVLRTDAALSGQIDFKGVKHSRVQVDFALPTSLTGPAGAVLPLSFAAGDAGYSASQSIANQTAFDPRLPFVATLSNNGRGSIFLGGTASPTAGQRAGTYTGLITITVAYLQ